MNPQPASPAARTRMETVDNLRGWAALAVCVFHYFEFNPRIARDSLALLASDLGRYGVDVFFVISGFVIPHALHRAGYGFGEYPRFLFKRLLRLEPPYLASIALVLLIKAAIWIRHDFNPAAWDVAWPQLLLHVGYLNAAFGHPWLNGVYWTLAVEFQYYLAIGLLFPWLVHRQRGRAALVFLILFGLALAAPEMPGDRSKAAPIYYWLILFLMGFIAFWQRNGFLKSQPSVILILLLAGAQWWQHRQDTGSALFAAAAALAICFWEIRSRSGAFLGEISYSLYLLHLPLMSLFFKLTQRTSADTALQTFLLVPAILLVLGTTSLFCRWVERPSQIWSARVRYQKAPG